MSRPAVVLLELLLLAAPTRGQLRWKPEPTSLPLPRAEPALAYDGARQRTVLFGGRHDDPGLADTWEWDGTVWTRRSPVQSPPARIGAALAYDAARGRTVLFGGRSATALSDTWVPNRQLARAARKIPAYRRRCAAV